MSEPQSSDTPHLPLEAARRIANICDRFDQTWSAGLRPRIEDFLSETQSPNERLELLKDLVHIECHYRRKAGESPQLGEFLERFPQDAEVVRSAFSELPRVPGYELLGELGRGGMGVVYRARHIGLNRLVALKMIRAGIGAGPDELARFRAEAEAIARLQHPNIVQVYEVGECGKVPYFSLELCHGGSLERKLAGTPLPPNAAAALVETVARAMQAAHEAGLVHRDLKPANVLLAADGTPKVTDFGLVKRLDEVGQTASNVILGTPSYMAPEQASGKSKEISPACDTYALGAILYECLTGRPPFKAATALDTVVQVLADDPVPPTQLQPRTPRDLETICLTCLHKLPTRRYGSALELAEELQRWQKGEPIRARPVGRVERAAKWMRRNPAPTAAAAALLIGTVVSLMFGLWASREADRARDNENTANKNADDATDARNKLAVKANEFEKQADELEMAFAQNFLRPLASNGYERWVRPPEWAALWDLAVNRHRRRRLGIRFVQEAFRDASSRGQLFDRAEFALPAAVGLDLRQHDAVEELLAVHLDDETLEETQKTKFALVLSTLRPSSASVSGQIARQLALAARGERATSALKELTDGLSAVAPHVASRDAATVVAALGESLKNEQDEKNIQALAESMSALSARMDPRDAAQVASVFTQAMKDTKDQRTWWTLEKRLLALTAQMEPNDIVPVATVLTEAMKNSKHHFTNQLVHDFLMMASRMGSQDAAQAVIFLANAAKDGKAFWMGLGAKELSAVTAQMGPEDATQAATIVIQALLDNRKTEGRSELLLCLSAIAERLDSKGAEKIAASLLQAMKERKGESVFSELVMTLVAVAARMERRAATTMFIEAMNNPNYSSALETLAYYLLVVDAQLDPNDAAQAATILVQNLEINDSTDPLFRAKSVSSLATHMKPKDAASAAAQVAARLAKEIVKDPPHLNRLLESLSAIAGYMEPQDVARIAATFVQAMKHDKPNPRFDLLLLSTLKALGSRMEAKDAAQAANTLILEMRQNSKRPLDLQLLAENVSAFAEHMGSKDAAAVSAEVATILAEEMNRFKDDASLSRATEYLGVGLMTVANRLEPKDAAQIATRLAQTLKDIKPNGSSNCFAVRQALSAAIGRLGSREAALVSVTLNRAIRETMNPATLPFLAASLTESDTRMKKDAVSVIAQAANTIANCMSDIAPLPGPNNDAALECQAEGLSALAPRLDNKGAAQVATVLALAMKKNTKSQFRLRFLAQGLSAVAISLEAKDAAQVADTLMMDVKDSAELALLLKGQTVLVTHLDADDTARAAAVLVEGIKNASSLSDDLVKLVDTLSAVSVRLTANDVSKLADTLLALDKDASPNGFTDQALKVAQGLVAITRQMDNATAVAKIFQVIKANQREDFSNWQALNILTAGLSKVAARMPPGEVAVVAINLIQAMRNVKRVDVVSTLAKGLPGLAMYLNSQGTAQVAAHLLTLNQSVEVQVAEISLGPVLTMLLTGVPQPSPSVTSGFAILGGTGHPLTALTCLAIVRPFCRLSPQQLVELLKMPTCFGECRRVVLDFLGAHYNRHFADQWEFARYAEEQHLDLDLLSPPQRPTPPVVRK